MTDNLSLKKKSINELLNRKIKINGKVTENFQTDFLNSNDLSVEDFWMVLYFQTLPYGTLEFGSLKQNFDNGR
ncbi:unnamed protein product [Rhizophagus irregularis]|nr:unnamed protein product [Rhizophagus irregularis]